MLKCEKCGKLELFPHENPKIKHFKAYNCYLCVENSVESVHNCVHKRK